MKYGWVAAAAAALLIGTSAPAWAQSLSRAWVSGHGTDSSGCGAPIAPCRSLQYAHDHIVVAGGEIDVLDPAGYGPVTISKSLSIVDDGVGLAGVQQLGSGNGITINAAAGDVVTLRGLTINGGGSGFNGIALMTGAALTVRDSTIQGFQQNGIVVRSGAGSVLVSDVVVSDVNTGINFVPTAAASLIVERAEITRSSNIAVLVDGTAAPMGTAVTGTVSDSVLVGNGVGVFANGVPSGTQPTGYVVNCLIVSNSVHGIISSMSNVYMNHSTLAGNSSDYLIQLSGVINSFGDNSLADTAHTGSLTPIGKQ